KGAGGKSLVRRSQRPSTPRRDDPGVTQNGRVPSGRDSLTDLEFFLAVADASSLTEAARNLNLSAPSVSRRLTRLESRLGVILVARSTRRADLTAEGRLYADRATRIIRQIEDLEHEVAGRDGPLRGTVTVRSTPGIGRHHLAGLVARFVEANPEVRVRLDLSSRPLETAAGPFDIGVRVGPPLDSRLGLRRLASNQRVLCASPDYLNRHGVPEGPEDLARHRCLQIVENEHTAAIWHLRSTGSAAAVPLSSPLVSNDGDVVTRWCVEGRGIVLRSTWHVNDLIEAGQLLRIMPGWRGPAGDVFAVYESERRAARRVMALVDYLASHLSPSLALRELNDHNAAAGETLTESVSQITAAPSPRNRSTR
ncbi:MAG: LysR family transcriptional regulator, partial [Nocardioides sp.]